MLSKKQNESKDKKLAQLNAEIEQMKRDLAAKDRELKRSKQILEQKEENLRNIQKVAKLKPNEVKSIAPEGSALEILRQIAINHQISPQNYSSSSGFQKENQGIMSHPFYKNINQRQQDSIGSSEKSLN